MAHIHSNALIGASGAAGAAGDDGYIVPKSLRIENGDSAHLSRTPLDAGNRRTWTWVGWVKRSKFSRGTLFSSGATVSVSFGLEFDNDNLVAYDYSGGFTWRLISSAVFRDPSAWYHVCVAFDSTQSTTANRVKFYVNGVQITNFSTSNYPSQNFESVINNNVIHTIGRYQNNTLGFNGYLADVQFVDGQALAPTDFGETRSTDGVWVPKEASFTSPNDGTIWSSSLSSPAGFQSSQPATNVFDGNIFSKCATPNNTGGYSTGETNAIEFVPSSSIPFTSSVKVTGRGTGQTTAKAKIDTGSGYGSEINLSGDGIETVISGSGNLVKLKVWTVTYAGENELGAILIDDVPLVDGAGTYGKNGFHLNFSDSSSNQALGLDSEPTVDLDPKKGFDVVTYTGNDDIRNIGGLLFEPGLVWLKTRTGHSSKNHGLFDVVRGPTKFLISNSTGAENSSYNNNLTAFNSDGFRVEEEPDFNASGRTYVGWCWRAGGPAVSNTDGDVTSQVSVNNDYGFSIVRWTNNGSNTPSDHQVGHGLNGTPDFVIVKNISSTSDWAVYSERFSNPVRDEVYLNNSNAKATAGVDLYYRDSTTVGFRAGSIGSSGNSQIAYCWKEVSGFSKFGTWTGTGSAGLKVTTGFKPRFLMWKRTDSAQNWAMVDSERSVTNPMDDWLGSAYTDAESANNSAYSVDFLDDGFSINATHTATNASGGNYLYMCFADRPGNNWDVNNIVTNEGLTTSKSQFDVVTYTGNGGTRKLGGPVFSSSADSGLTHANGVTGMFDGSLSTRGGAPSTDNSYKTLTDGASISASTGIRIYWNGVGAGQRYIRINGTTELDDGSAALTPGWSTQSSFSGTINKIEVKTASSGSWSLAAVEVDGTILIDGTGPGLKFQPDLIWLKGRSYSISHLLYDSVRGYGADKELVPNGSNAEGAAGADSTYGYVSAVNSSGFTVEGGSDANNGYTNKNNATYVAWCWKAGSTASSNSNGSITSSVSANAAYGFSIVSYTGTGSNATVGHGLNAEPELLIIKNRSSAQQWDVYHKEVGYGKVLRLNSDAAPATASDVFPSSNTSSVFKVGSSSSQNGSGNSMIAYCFANVPGYQRIGSYTGNGSSTGPVVVTGFKPKFLLVKNTNSSRNWVLWDTERVNNDTLKANSSGAEESAYQVDVLPNGFQIKNTWNEFNENNATIVYLAIGDDEIGPDEDCLVDVPNAVTADADATDTTGGYQRGNYATINPLDTHSDLALSNGSLEFNKTGTNGYGFYKSTIGVSSGKWYAEFTMGGQKQNVGITLASHPVNNSTYAESGTNSGVVYYSHNGYKYGHGSAAVYGETFADGDVIGIALDLDNSKVYFSKNGVFQNSGDPVAGANPAQSGLSGTYVFAGHSNNTSNTTMSGKWNFGQMRFKYPIPSGYAAVNTTALPAATIRDGSAHFETKLYTGNGGTNTITGLEFSPDWTWIKRRNSTSYHSIHDTIRGATKRLRSDSNAAETTETTALTAFTSDGFTLGSGGTANGNNDSFVSWNWDAGSSTVSNTDGSITSSVRANPSAGFSICKITTPSSDGAYTFGHGLNAAPEFIIYRIYDQNMSWYVYHKGLGAANKYTLLNATNAANSGTYVFNNTHPTSTLVTDYAGNSSHHNEGRDMIYYCFTPVAGFSQIGTFVNPSASESAFVYCGFKPAFLLAKCAENISSSSGTGDWIIKDSKRSPFNTPSNGNTLVANVTNGEDAYYNANQAAVDFLSNGFKIRHNNTSPLGDPGRRYIFIAFAENPFQANGGLAS